MQSTWDPLRLRPLIWLPATLHDVRITGGNQVVDWRSRTGDTQRIPASNAPNWEPNGWGSNIGAVRFSQAAGGPFFSTTSGSLAALGGGLAQPFSILMTVHQVLVADHVLVCWDDTGGPSVSNFRVDNTGGGRLRYTRTDVGSTTNTVTASADIGTGHQRVGMAYRGQFSDLFTGRAGVTSGDSGSGTSNINRFRFGTGPVIDAFTGVFAELVVLERAISLSEWQAYFDYSVRRWGI